MKQDIISSVIKNSKKININYPLKANHNYDLVKIQSRSSIKANIIAYLMDNNQKSPIAVIKTPRDPLNNKYIFNENDNLNKLHYKIKDEKIKEKLPQSYVDIHNESTFLVQEYMTGNKMIKIMHSPRKVKKQFPIISNWLFSFYESLPNKKVLNSSEVVEYLNKMFNNFTKLYPDAYRNLNPEIVKYFSNISEKIGSKNLTLIGQHNDFNAHNIIVNSKKNELDDFSVIDWEDYTEQSLPIIDINHFFISNSGLLPKDLGSENFDKYFIKNNFYQDLYKQTINTFVKFKYLDKELFTYLTPYYFIHMCLIISKENRNQEKTLNTWIKRLENYLQNIKKFL